ncbi:MAG TPA: ABC transporter permease subunit [Planctomycetota bacterium]|nr:ABC transporter permease subunit [Planctomycetota bacterium]
MNATYSVFRRELLAYFKTPIGYVFMAFFLLVTNAFYSMELFSSGTADMRGFFGLLPLFFLFFVPAISMRLWSEERKLGTLEWLLTLPMNAWNAVLGKYFAGLAFIAITLLLSFPIPLFLKIYGNPDFGPIIGGYMGAMVLGMIYLAIGSFASSLTSDQIIAFVVGVTIGLIFFLMGIPQILDTIKEHVGAGFASKVQLFGINSHFESISRGVVDIRDVLFAVSLSGVFLFLNYLVVDRRR